MSAGGSRVAVVYNRPALPPDHPDAASEADVARVAAAVAQALERSGFQASTLAAGPPLAGFLAALEAAGPDLVFNLVEGFAGNSALAAPLTAVFELLGLPFTGSTAEAFAVCRSKARAKALLRGLGLPTAPGALVEVGGPVPALEPGRPVLVKPDGEDGSLGIDQGSVVSDPGALAERLRRLGARYGGPVLVEEYLPGPEFNVGIRALPDPQALPVAQVVHADVPGRWPILTYGAKWDEGSPEDRATPVVCPAPIEPELAERLGALAVAAFRATSCRDYARVDFRLNDRGEPMILEVNPNPDLGPGAGFARAAVAAGWNYEGVVAAVARQALNRAGPG